MSNKQNMNFTRFLFIKGEIIWLNLMLVCSKINSGGVEILPIRLERKVRKKSWNWKRF